MNTVTPIIIHDEVPTCMVGEKKEIERKNEKWHSYDVKYEQYNSCINKYVQYRENESTFAGDVAFIVGVLSFCVGVAAFIVRLVEMFT